jgi:uncharacterized membrane protein
VVVLAVLGRNRPSVLVLYMLAALAIIAGGVITRFLNQPINDQIMGWTPTAMPEDWTSLRDRWWYWHQARLATMLGAQFLLIAAVFTDRGG